MTAQRRPEDDGVGPGADEVVALADWRRRVAELYATVRHVRVDDPREAHERWRRGRDHLFATHPQSPLTGDGRRRFAGLPIAPYDEAFAVAAPLRGDVAHERFPVGTSGGGTIDFVRVGRVDLPWGRLDVYWLDGYGGGLFLPFRDATAGAGTYGGGRYLLDTVKGADLGTRDGALILDFNFAYHPSCAYNAAWSCPLAPPGNRLAAALPVGEQLLDG